MRRLAPLSFGADRFLAIDEMPNESGWRDMGRLWGQGTPKLLFVTPAKIIVITSQNSGNYAKVFDKAALGL